MTQQTQEPVATRTPSANAAIQADLWGTRARDWADVLEGWNGWGIPLYRHVLERVPVGSGARVLDVGCGARAVPRTEEGRGARPAPGGCARRDRDRGRADPAGVRLPPVPRAAPERRDDATRLHGGRSVRPRRARRGRGRGPRSAQRGAESLESDSGRVHLDEEVRYLMATE